MPIYAINTSVGVSKTLGNFVDINAVSKLREFKDKPELLKRVYVLEQVQRKHSGRIPNRWAVVWPWDIQYLGGSYDTKLQVETAVLSKNMTYARVIYIPRSSYHAIADRGINSDIDALYSTTAI